MPARKAPGPDGFIAEFLHACWPTIQQDFIDAFWQLYALRGRRFSCLNQALLTLLPKRTDAHGLGDYRPISLIDLQHPSVGQFKVHNVQAEAGAVGEQHERLVPDGWTRQGHVLPGERVAHDEVGRRRRRGGSEARQGNGGQRWTAAESDEAAVRRHSLVPLEFTFTIFEERARGFNGRARVGVPPRLEQFDAAT